MASVDELEDQYRHLQEQLLRNELTEDEFRAQVDQLRLSDPEGRQWKLGALSGRWYRLEGGHWIEGNPRLHSPPAPLLAQPAARAPALRRWLPALAVVGILALAVVGLIWIGSGPAAETPVALATSTRQETPSPSVLPSPMVLPALPTTLPAAAAATALQATPLHMPLTASPLPSASPTSLLPTPQATAGLGGWLAVPVYNSLTRTFDIHRVRPDGSGRLVLVSSASQPAVSPDGTRIAYRSWRSDQRALIARPVSGGSIWPFAAASEASRPSWSPLDGSLVYASRQESDRRSRIHRTWNTETVMIRRHGGGVEGRSPAWMSDGRLVYQGCVESLCGLLIMNADGTFPVQVTDHTSDTAPEPSADGVRIAFMSQRDGNWEVYLVDADGTHLRRLTDHPGHDGLPAWSPDGQHLAFVSNRGGAWAVWMVDPGGSGLRKLFELGGDLEGIVAAASAHEQGGWTEERISWSP